MPADSGRAVSAGEKEQAKDGGDTAGAPEGAPAFRTPSRQGYRPRHGATHWLVTLSHAQVVVVGQREQLDAVTALA